MKVLITGANGKLGQTLGEVLAVEHTVVRAGRYDGADVHLELTDFAGVKATITQVQPDVVINSAAWTDVDGCARDPERAIAINGFGARHLAIASAGVGAAIVQISSNEVFDGQLKRPYYEYDQRNPVNPYGYSKYVGERAVVEVNPRHYVVRTAWLFAYGGRNFIHAILNAANAGKALRVVTDEVANPTYNDDLAQAVAQLITTGNYGTYHLVNEGVASRYQFARYVLDNTGHQATPIEPISRHSWSRPSIPPLYAGMANLAAAQIGIQLRPWQSAVDAFLSREQLRVIEES